MIHAVRSGVAISSVVTYQRCLKAFCTGDRIPWMQLDGDAQHMAEFLDGLRVADPGEVKRPPALTMAWLSRVHDRLDTTNPQHRQIWLRMLLSHHLMLRGGDTCDSHLRREHVQLKPGGLLEVKLVKRKDNRRGGPRVSYLFRSDNPAFDAPRLMARYLADTGLDARPHAPLFPLLDVDGKAHLPIKTTSYDAWRRTFRHWTATAGMVGATPHAARAGGLTDAVLGGADPFVAAKAGGWSPMGCWPTYLRMPDEDRGRMMHGVFEQRRTASQPVSSTSVPREPPQSNSCSDTYGISPSRRALARQDLAAVQVQLLKFQRTKQRAVVRR